MAPAIPGRRRTPSPRRPEFHARLRHGAMEEVCLSYPLEEEEYDVWTFGPLDSWAVRHSSNPSRVRHVQKRKRQNSNQCRLTNGGTVAPPPPPSAFVVRRVAVSVQVALRLRPPADA